MGYDYDIHNLPWLSIHGIHKKDYVYSLHQSNQNLHVLNVCFYTISVDIYNQIVNVYHISSYFGAVNFIGPYYYKSKSGEKEKHYFLFNLWFIFSIF